MSRSKCRGRRGAVRERQEGYEAVADVERQVGEEQVGRRGHADPGTDSAGGGCDAPLDESQDLLPHQREVGLRGRARGAEPDLAAAQSTGRHRDDAQADGDVVGRRVEAV